MARLLDTTTPLTLRCATVQDIAAALAYARQEGLALGGEGGVLLDLSALQAIHIDAVRRIAWVQPGVQQADLEAELQVQRRVRGVLDQPLVLGPPAL